jgi:hypothetical protein
MKNLHSLDELALDLLWALVRREPGTPLVYSSANDDTGPVVLLEFRLHEPRAVRVAVDREQHDATRSHDAQVLVEPEALQLRREMRVHRKAVERIEGGIVEREWGFEAVQAERDIGDVRGAPVDIGSAVIGAERFDPPLAVDRRQVTDHARRTTAPFADAQWSTREVLVEQIHHEVGSLTTARPISLVVGGRLGLEQE